MRASVAEARNGFSSILAQLADGTIGECVVEKRNVPVARIVPIAPARDTSKRIGLCEGDERFAFDYGGFMAMDDEIAGEFGM